MIRLGSMTRRLVLGSGARLRANVITRGVTPPGVGSRADERVRIAYAWQPSAAARFEPVTYQGEQVTYRGEPVVVRVR